MELQKNYFDMLMWTIDDVIERIDKPSTIEEKLYFFSAVYGTANKIMNFECDPLLVLLHQEIQSTHANFTGRINQPINPNNESFMGMPDEFVIALIAYTKELRTALVKNNDSEIRLVIQKFANLSYASTGNGFYLYTIGRLKI
jgi:hypothetical protein